MGAVQVANDPPVRVNDKNNHRMQELTIVHLAESISGRIGQLHDLVLVTGEKTPGLIRELALYRLVVHVTIFGSQLRRLGLIKADG